MQTKYKAKTGVAWSARFSGTSVSGRYQLTAVEKKVQCAGGRLADGDTVTFCLAWSARCDLDIHLRAPNGEECYYRAKQLQNGAGQVWAELDVDKQAQHYPDQVENIYLNKTLAPRGEYVAVVKLYSNSSESKQIHWQSTFNNTASGEAQQREQAGMCDEVKQEVEIARFIL
jgi:uncharacterized protein YfaP (DUF2135 family)